MGYPIRLSLRIMKYFYNAVILLSCSSSLTNTEHTVYGPGLQPEDVVLPARYFFVNLTSFINNVSSHVSNDFTAEIFGKTKKHNNCRVWLNKLDRKDGTFIFRYKIYETCNDLNINLFYKKKHIGGSPLKFKGPNLPEECSCPEKDFELWLQKYGCQNSMEQILSDLTPFSNLNMKHQIPKIIKRFYRPESTSFCHYAVKNNEIYRDCYGKHVGFNTFADNILLSLARKVKLPDMELVINLGDWPLVHKHGEKLPIFSWCGSDDTMDIVMPTYDITESTLENMGRVTLDLLSVQGNVEREWSKREPKAFWRGRDSRMERLKLIEIARANPDLINASLTNFFFFRDKEQRYGPKEPHISFFKFFDYKYQINIDGTVAAYRFPYLLAGGGMVLKQESPFYEHFYKQLQPWEHYVPVARDLSNLKERIIWATKNDDKSRKIAENGRKFVNDNLLPQHILCYHALLFWEWSKRTIGEVEVLEDMTHVPQPKNTCTCHTKENSHQEL